MNGIDGETLIQILIFVAIFGAAIIQFIFRNLVKPLREAERTRMRLYIPRTLSPSPAEGIARPKAYWSSPMTMRIILRA